MSLRAVIKTGGKQYLVKEGEILEIEKAEDEVGKKIFFEDVLLVFNEKGEDAQIGQPNLKVKVEAEILEQKRGKKITVVKYKAKTRYHRRTGHRQLLTKVKILKISLEKKSVKVSEKKALTDKKTEK